MNPNRLRPTDVKRENLDLWLSGVINDAIRDAREAGMPQREMYELLKTFAAGEHPLGIQASWRVQDKEP